MTTVFLRWVRSARTKMDVHVSVPNTPRATNYGNSFVMHSRIQALARPLYGKSKSLRIDCDLFAFRWEDPEQGVFRIIESEKLARLWGEKKNNQKMTYEKLSRAMRTYYEKQILVPVPKTGLYPKKLVYKFGPGKSLRFQLDSNSTLFRRPWMDCTTTFGASLSKAPTA